MSVRAVESMPALRQRIWTALPALAVSGSVVSAAAAPAVIIFSTVGPLALLWFGLLVAPLFGGLLAQAADVIVGAEPTALSYGRYLRAGWRSGLLAGIVPAAAGGVFMISWRWWNGTGSPLALAPLFSAGLVSTLALLCAIIAPALAWRMPRLRGWPLVLFSLHVVARRPVPVLGVVALLVIMVGAAVRWSASVLVLMPAPLALVSVAAAWRTAAVSADWRAATAGQSSESPAQ